MFSSILHEASCLLMPRHTVACLRGRPQPKHVRVVALQSNGVPWCALTSVHYACTVSSPLTRLDILSSCSSRGCDVALIVCDSSKGSPPNADVPQLTLGQRSEVVRWPHCNFCCQAHCSELQLLWQAQTCANRLELPSQIHHHVLHPLVLYIPTQLLSA